MTMVNSNIVAHKITCPTKSQNSLQDYRGDESYFIFKALKASIYQAVIRDPIHYIYYLIYRGTYSSPFFPTAEEEPKAHQILQ